MKEFDELMRLAAAHPMPKAFISAAWAYAQSLQDRGQSQAPAGDPLATKTP